MSGRKVLHPAKYVYKVCAASDWRAALARGTYDGSPDDLRDGFVHLSTAAQLAGVLQRYYAGLSNLIIIAFESEALGDELQWEKGSSDTFPHLYGPLAVANAVSTHALPADEAERAALLKSLK